ncbi:hypothetical protein HG536_0C02490 [Torulaspora globosa]|uniref:V-type proton ATPase subunit S1/VOA1 transmembrane domain-containing protein n=1 Tax=Torulaspora globosa TaxID=48254 RepID=A0A7G3ZEZ4_9SACH|nr:uncharacterized protein HG536_0C02490 [Torulaspora globosa]QLL32080.1 hypothetical protein HG536_0C02490 [Torulaspora globosa]
MVGRSLALAAAVVLQIVSQVVASTSYVSLRSENNADVSSVSELISQANEEAPIVIFRFTDYPIVEAWKLDEGHAPYLAGFLESGNAYQEDFSFDELYTDAESEVFNLGDLTLSASELLYNYDLKGKSVVLFNFDRSNYELGSVDEFMESAYLFLADSIDGIEKVVLNVARTANLHRSTASDRSTERAKVEQEKEKPGEGDDGALSTIWTEGLIMCLIVSLLLLAILVVAISWMSSMEISYGALERSTNPLKKTK